MRTFGPAPIISFATRLFLILSVILVAAGCREPSPPAAPPALPVDVVTVERRDLPLMIEMVGATLGTQDVPIRARVEGFLESMTFEEGRFVEKGALLYTIDAQPFQAKLVEAQSRRASAETQLVKARSDLARIRPLAEMKAVSEQDLDAAVAQEAAARAGLRAADAGVELAEIELSYTRIKAPIAGLIGLTKAKPGEFVGRDPNPVVLNTLSDIDPILVRFSISEREYLILARKYISQGSREQRSGARQNDLVLILADGTEHPHKGMTISTAQAISSETGTFTLEASFPNPSGLLLPGQFARVRAPYQTLEDVLVVPRKALVELQGRFQVYVVNSDNAVEVRDVQLGPFKDNDVVIESGIEAGARVIVEGLQKVRSGMQVAPADRQPGGEPIPLQET